jgi:hypothetical protein
MLGTERKMSDRVRKTRETARNTFAIASEKTRTDRVRKLFFQVMCFFMCSIIPALFDNASLFWDFFSPPENFALTGLLRGAKPPHFLLEVHLYKTKKNKKIQGTPTQFHAA